MQSNRAMGGRSVLFVTSEAYPLVKTGGLADYAGGLTKALARDGCDLRLLLPNYAGAADRLVGPVDRVELDDRFGVGATALLCGRMPGAGVPVWLIDCPALYTRGGGIYQDADGEDWPDNALRFGLLARVAAWLTLGRGPIGWQPDVVHLNEWQTGPAAALLALQAQAPPTLFTIHNMAFQGLFGPDVLAFLGLPPSTFTSKGLEFFGKVSFLKAGIRYANRISTVSETYAREIMTPAFGCGLEGLLQQRAHDVVGILNGVDDEDWCPQKDAHLAAHFGPHDLAGKRRCKQALREAAGLRTDADLDVPLFAHVSRLTHQKMADVLVDAVPAILARGAQLVILGRGDRAVERKLTELAQQFAGALAVFVGYEEPLAHRILAGADILLAPARFEPCGLTQMYALRYGTVPIVSRVGGLRETVVDAQPGASERSATGFVFDEPTLAGLLAAIDCALAAYRHGERWRALQQAGMRADYSWRRSARKYEQIYDDLAARRAGAETSVPRHGADPWQVPARAPLRELSLQ